MHNAQEAVLGCVMHDQRRLPEVLATGLPDEAFREPYAAIWRSIRSLSKSGHPIDPVTVGEHLRAAGQLDDAMISWLDGCLASVGLHQIGEASYYATIVLENYCDHRKAGIWQQAEERRLAGDSEQDVINFILAESESLSRPVVANGFAAGLFSHAEFMERKHDESYIVSDVLVEGQHCLVGGPSKGGKTMLMADAAISIGSGTHFLGRFPTEQRHVLILSGESGENTLRRYAMAIESARSIDRAQVVLTWGMHLPELSNPRDLLGLERVIQDRDIGVVIVDPVYLALLKGGNGKTDTHRITDMGLLLGEVGAIGQRTGATLVFGHHATKALPEGKAMELRDLSGSGFDAWARQWILVSRKRPYDHNLQHELMLNVGGSAGHSGLYRCTLDESTWQIDFDTSEAQAKREEAAAASAAFEELDRLEQAAANHPEGESLTTLRAEARVDNHVAADRMRELVRQGRLEKCLFQRGGKGRKYDGFRPVIGSEQ